MSNPKTGLWATHGQHERCLPALMGEAPPDSRSALEDHLIHAASARAPHNSGGWPSITDRGLRTSEYRSERISKLRMLISQGNYVVPADEVAARILTSLERP